MTKRFITDEELVVATTMVSEAMLRALPEPEDCIGQFTAQFEEKIEKLKKTAVRKVNSRKFARSAVAAILVILIGFSMLCVFNTEVRAAVVTWFKETFETYTTYWFTTDEDTLPQYELMVIPDGFELVYEAASDHMCVMAYQRGNDVKDSFTFDYAVANNDTLLTIHTLYANYKTESVIINGCFGELYISDNPEESSTLVWLDETTNIVFTLSSYMGRDDMLHIANNVNLVN